METLKWVGISLGVYLFTCFFCTLPWDSRDYPDCVQLPKPIAAILFLPLVIGGGRDFRIFGIVMQICNFIFGALMAILHAAARRGATFSDKLLSYLLFGWLALIVSASLIWLLIRYLKERKLLVRPRRKRWKRRRRK